MGPPLPPVGSGPRGSYLLGLRPVGLVRNFEDFENAHITFARPARSGPCTQAGVRAHGDARGRTGTHGQARRCPQVTLRHA